MKFAIILAVLLASACSEDEYTWGEVSQQLSFAYCEALDSCGYGSGEEWVSRCKSHTKFHLCDQVGTCSVVMPQGSVAVVDECLAAFTGPDYAVPSSWQCFALGYGVSPVECAGVWEIEPGTEE